jgi:hypothetical protein
MRHGGIDVSTFRNSNRGEMRSLLLKRVIKILFSQREDGTETPQIDRMATTKDVCLEVSMTIG